MAHNKPCPVKLYTFYDCCFKCARELLGYEEFKRLKIPHDGWMRIPDAAKMCKMSEPTFRKMGRKFLDPDTYGEVPEYFRAGRTVFDDYDIVVEEKKIQYDAEKNYSATELPTLKRGKR